MKATASYSYEGLVAADIEPYAADRDGVSDKGCESRLSRYPQAVFKLGAPSYLNLTHALTHSATMAGLNGGLLITKFINKASCSSES